ncbi:MAG: MBL fold metallo-hydrolase [Clostridia bacterium]|nr:MBL fold metallo-hydrolase [Clostridia bacterium]
MGGQFKLRVDIAALHHNVTGSRKLFTVHAPEGKIKFLIDCGLYQGEENADELNREPFEFDTDEISFVIATHNHTDHIGRIPLLYRRGYVGKVHTTKDTAKMLRYSLLDSEKVLKMNADEYGLTHMYSQSDVYNALNNTVPHMFGATFEPVPGIKITFYMNGHLVGAALTHIHIDIPGFNPVEIIDMGDYKKYNKFFVVEDMPKYIFECPVNLITEATYGYVDSTDAAKPVFAKNIVEILEEKNLILVPVFALARGQEVLYELNQMQKRGELPLDIPIYIDGKLFMDYCSLYRYNLDIADEMREFYPSNMHVMNKDHREEIVRSRTKKIILTTSGMGNYGPAQEYIPMVVERKDSCIHFVGYQAQGTIGRALLEANYGDEVDLGMCIKKKKCDVRTTGEFSTHAKRDELVDFFKRFKNIRSLLIQHGEEEVKDSFAEYCGKKLDNCKNIEVLGNDFTVALDSWGVVKLIDERLR